MSLADKPVDGVSPAEQEVADAVARKLFSESEVTFSGDISYSALEDSYVSHVERFGCDPREGWTSPLMLAEIGLRLQTQQRLTPHSSGTAKWWGLAFNGAVISSDPQIPYGKLVWRS